MKKSELEIILDEIDFLDKANNIYETKTYIIRQEVSVEIINGITVIYSRDTFYAKTGLRIPKLMELIKEVNEQHKRRITTGMLNDVINEAVAKQQPPSGARSHRHCRAEHR